ncbi:endo-1,4-beta-xylanase, partial [bacterium]|nr:endo-1,4-beta-xylanase [bacterium]
TDDNKSSSDSLKDAFKDKFKIGTSVSPNEFNVGSDFIKKHFNSITPENELKPDFIINQQACQSQGNNVNTQVVFGSGTQTTLKFCEDNGIPLRGHTFVWYSQTPDWFFRENFNSGGNYASKDIMDQRLESFIKNTFELIASKYPKLEVYAYDVANELFLNDGGGMRDAGNSNWVKIYGDDSFVVKAFTYARKYAPKGCKLFINDYNEYIPAKTDDIYNMAMKLKQLGVIDGIGMQSHLDIGFPSASLYKTALEKFISTGLEVQITELDITTNNNFTAQAELFKSIFQLAVDNASHITALTLWGTNDSISWRSGQNPLLFSQGYTPKEAYYAVMEVAKSSSSSTDDNKSSSDSLKDAFKDKFKIGTSVSPNEFNVGSDFIKKHFNSITPENELKPDFIINQQACQSQGNNVNTQVVFGSGTQTTLKFCEDNGIPLRGHTFVWYSQTPDWFFRENFNSGGNYVSKDIMDQRLESFIKNTFELIASKYPKLEVYAYDVANELFLNDGGGMRDAGNSNWVKI